MVVLTTTQYMPVGEKREGGREGGEEEEVNV